MAKPLPSHFRTGAWNLFFEYSNVAYALLSGIFLVPLYLKFVDPGVYGAWLALFGIMQWFLIVDPGISTVSIQMAARALAERDTKKLSSLVFFTVVFHVGLGLIVYLALRLSFDTLLRFLSVAPAHYGVIREAYGLASVATALTLVSYGAVALCQGLQSSLSIGTIFVFANYLSLGISVLMLFRGYGILSISISLLMRAVLMVTLNHAYLVVKLRRLDLSVRHRPDLSYGKEILKNSGHNFLGKSSRAIVQNLDTVLISRYLGSETVVAYSLMKKSSWIARILLERISVALMPVLSNQVLSEKSKLLAGNVYFSALYGGFGFLLLNVLFNKTFLHLWVGDRYFLGFETNLLISTWMLVAIINTTTCNIFVALGEFRFSNLAILAGNFCSVPLAYVGLKLAGVPGMVAGLLLATLAVTFLALHLRLFRAIDLRHTFMREVTLNLAAVVMLATGLSLVPRHSISVLDFALYLLLAMSLYVIVTVRFSAGGRVYWTLFQRIYGHIRGGTGPRGKAATSQRTGDPSL